MHELFWLLLPVAAFSGWLAAIRGNKPKASSAQGSRLRSDYFRGLNYLANEQPDKAIEVLTHLLEVDSDTVETHLALGSLFRRRGEVDRAIRIHQNLISRPKLNDSERGEALLELGQDYMCAGLFDRAEGLFKELVDARPFNDRALRELTDIYQREKDWEQAVQTARQREKANGHSYGRVIAYYYCEQAELNCEDGQVDKALDLVKRALDVSSQCVRASLLEGQLLKAREDYRGAIRAFKRVEQQDAFYISEVIAELQDCYRQVGRISELMEYLDYVQEQFGCITATLAMTEIKAEGDNEKEAIVFLTEQLRRRPSVRGLHRLTEMALQHMDDSSRSYLLILKDLMEQLLADRSAYECHHCGFTAKSLHWQCPSCKYWGSIKPVQGVAGE